MDPFAAAAQLLGQLSGLGQQFAAIGLGVTGFSGSGFGGEFTAGTVTSMAGDTTAAAGWAINLAKYRQAVSTIHSKMPYDQHLVADFVEVWQGFHPAPNQNPPVPDLNARERQHIENYKATAKAGSIIAWTMTVIDALELLAGFGPPDEGDALRAGSHQFSGLSTHLGMAVVDDGGWRGSASHTYTCHDIALHQRAIEVAELDTQLAAVINDQSAWVTHVRLGFGILKDLLALALIVELALRSAGAPVALIWAMAAAAIIAALAMLAALAYFSSAHAQQADDLMIRYARPAMVTVTRHTLAPTSLATAARSGLRSIGVVPGAISVTAEVSGVPGDTHQQGDPISARASESE